ncbi:MAG: M3 family metallopeptidase, partial [Gammaproteobacteria bacterium]|nr:M3 family metallopeptidase [Gammaproteobacteria bacterium]
LPLLSDYHTELGQNRALYEGYQQVRNSAEYAQLSQAQQKIIENTLRDFRLSGIELSDSERARYKTIRQTLSQLASKFSENVLDSNNAWEKLITDESELAGLPDGAMGLLRQQAQAKGHKGWLLNLDAPAYMPVINYADNRALREEMFQAYATRASDQGPHDKQYDNSDLMEQILALRHEMAGLLGFDNYAELSVETKMAECTAQVMQFLNDLANRSVTMARKEYADLCDYARQQHGADQLAAWDVGYYAEKLREHRYSFTQEEVKPYLPEDRVLEGLFSVVNRLFGVRVVECQDVDTWHEDVRFFEIQNADGSPRGQFYLDLYARAKKKGGAWMDDCIPRKRSSAGVQVPVAYLTCNFSPPVGNEPALFTHREVETLFHEFGHGLQHMLTQVDYVGVSGINGVEWDAVELPSQIMENWCWQKEALALFSSHYQTGAPLPDALFEKMQAARNFQSAMMMVRQLEFGLFDFRIHLEYDPQKGGRVLEILDEVRDQVAAYKPPVWHRFPNAFSHIFAGGYAAGYYSYKWAEVLSSDAFAAFEETHIFDAGVGRQFMQTVLEQGGSRKAMALFVAFRGREPQIDALLRHSGIAA